MSLFRFVLLLTPCSILMSGIRYGLLLEVDQASPFCSSCLFRLWVQVNWVLGANKINGYRCVYAYFMVKNSHNGQFAWEKCNLKCHSFWEMDKSNHFDLMKSKPVQENQVFLSFFPLNSRDSTYFYMFGAFSSLIDLLFQKFKCGNWSLTVINVVNWINHRVRTEN